MIREVHKGEELNGVISLENYRLSPSTETVALTAELEAVQTGAPDVDTDHLLVGLAEDATIGSLFAAHSVTPADIRKWSAFVRRRDTKVLHAQRLELSELARDVLDLAHAAASHTPSSIIEPWTLLEALWQVRKGIAYGFMERASISPDDLRDALVQTRIKDTAD